MWVGDYGKLQHGKTVMRLRDNFLLLMWWLASRHKNHFSQVERSAYLFRNYQMTIVDGIKCSPK
jgi:hypothetical protein